MNYCCHCKRSEDYSLGEDGKYKVELRPYGPNGSFICFDCMISNTDLEKIARDNYTKRLDRADARTGASLLASEGPIPYIGKY